jgi:acyl-CoA synthetase (AMP-forming)/AMP-acid ligase II
MRPGPRDLFYVARSMVHSATLVGEVLLAFWSGASLFAASPRVPAAQMFRWIHERGATIVCVNPSLLRFFAGAGATEERLRSLHTIHVSGAIVDRNVFRRVHERFPWIRLINGYGLTEAGPRVAQLGTTEGLKGAANADSRPTLKGAANADSRPTLKPGSVGKAIRGVSLEVRGQDGGRCAAYAVGEVFVRSPSLLDGYLREGGLMRIELRDGALPTGDLGYLDDDGDLFIIGRKDDMIITGGHNVDPREVEEAVLEVAGIEDCIVFGVEDALLGQRVVCAYTADPEGPEGDAQLERRAREACAGALAGHQVPKRFCRWRDIPLSPGGKRSRLLAQRRFLAVEGR